MQSIRKKNITKIVQLGPKNTGIAEEGQRWASITERGIGVQMVLSLFGFKTMWLDVRMVTGSSKGKERFLVL